MSKFLKPLRIVAFAAFFVAPSVQAAIEVVARKLETTELFDSLSYPARASSAVNAQVIADADGVVQKILVPIGGKVSATQGSSNVILVLKHTDPVYDYAPIKVTSPVTGVVSVLDFTEGSRVSRGQRLAVITDPTKIRLQLEAPASDLAALQAGLEGELKLPGSSESTKVKVRGISPFIDSSTGTATTELDFVGSAPAALRPGMLGYVSFKINLRKGISIPEKALVYRGTDPFVRTVVDKKAKRIPVTLGKSSRGNIEILSGLSAGDMLIERATSHLVDGDEVALIDTLSGAK